MFPQLGYPQIGMRVIYEPVSFFGADMCGCWWYLFFHVRLTPIHVGHVGQKQSHEKCGPENFFIHGLSILWHRTVLEYKVVKFFNSSQKSLLCTCIY